MRNEQRSTGRETELTTFDSGEVGEIWRIRNSRIAAVKRGAKAAMYCWFESLALASGCDGKSYFFCESAQHFLFAQQLWHALPTAGLVTGHTDAGNRTALRKSAVIMTIPIVARATIQTFSTIRIENLIASL
jgi:hypothetical protein